MWDEQKKMYELNKVNSNKEDIPERLTKHK